MRNLKRLALLLIMTMVFTMFAACGSGRTPDDGEETTKRTTKTTQATEANDEDKDSESSGLFGGGSDEDEDNNDDNGEKDDSDDKDTEGTELSDFVTKYTDAKQVIWDKISAELESGADMNASMAMLGFAFADMAIIIVPFFDSVEYTGGTMMFSEVNNAYKKVNGDKITFGYDYTYKEDTDNNKQGDHTFCEGLYDMGKQSMTVEMYEETDGKVTSRTIIEVTENKDKSFSSQLVSYSEGSENVSGYFTTFEGENLWSRMAEKEGDAKFGYNSVMGNKTATLDEMTNGYTIKTEVSYIDGKAEVKTAE